MDDEGKQEPARSRWAPKPEQILILESIFNSGTVNPSKDETSRIRMLLQRYGPVADANVFYWFQNRRSRSRRNRLRAHDRATSTQNNNNNNNNINNSSFQCEDNFLPNTSAVVGPTSSFPLHTNILHYDHQYLLGGNYNYVNSENNASNYSYACSPHLNYEPDVITVYINGVATEVGRGAVNINAIFSGDFVMYHSSGVPVEVNEYGYVVQGLQHGESYFIVPRNS